MDEDCSKEPSVGLKYAADELAACMSVYSSSLVPRLTRISHRFLPFVLEIN